MNMKKIIMSLALALGVSVGVQAADKPQYPGGQEALDQYLTENLKYPEMARENGVVLAHGSRPTRTESPWTLPPA